MIQKWISVFKTDAFDHSANNPVLKLTLLQGEVVAKFERLFLFVDHGKAGPF
jgi:hypothetical protein